MGINTEDEQDQNFIEMYMLYSKEQLLRSLANNIELIQTKRHACKNDPLDPFQQKSIQYARERIRAATKALHKKVKDEHEKQNRGTEN